MTERVRTALGDIPAADLGRVDYHEHLFHRSPLLPGDDLDDERASRLETSALLGSGFEAMVESTPIGLGRRPEAIARIARATGLHAVLTTGAHREEHYVSDHPLRQSGEDALTAVFLADIVDGMHQIDVGDAPLARTPDGAPIRAGIVKVGLGYWRISAFERRVLAAASAAHRATGAPVMVHLEHASAAFEVLELLGEEGVRADAVVLAHVDRTPDPMLHAELAAEGAYLGYDGWTRFSEWPTSTLVECAVSAIEQGAGRRLLFGGDLARRSRFLSYGGMPGLAHLGRRAVPALENGIGVAALRAVLVENPARLLARF